jgi:hypothetical protein
VIYILSTSVKMVCKFPVGLEGTIDGVRVVEIYRDLGVVSLSLEVTKLLLLKVRTLHSQIQGSI